MSFCYDRPILNLTGLWRVDPRPFDIVFVAFLLYVLTNKSRLHSRIRRSWYLCKPMCFIILWFSVIVIYQFSWLSFSYQRYSIFFLIKYLQLFVGIWLVATSDLSTEEKKKIIKIFLFTVIVVAIVGVLQFYGYIHYTRFVSQGEFDMSGWGALGKEVRITSTLDVHYVYFGQYSVLGVVLSILLLIIDWNTKNSRILATVSMIAGFIGILLSQSLSAIVTVCVFFITLLILRPLLKSKLLRRRIIYLTMFCVLIGGIAFTFSPENVTSRVFRSLNFFNEGISSPENPLDRLDVGINYPNQFFKQADFQDIIVGRGFYVARGDMGQRRIGYGIHNIVVFPLEQAGIPGFFLGLYVFFVFITNPFRQLKKERNNNFRQTCGLLVFCWAVAMIIAGQSGQIFWIFQGFGNLFLIMLCIWSLLISPQNVNNASQ